jgi:hypothetical protein
MPSSYLNDPDHWRDRAKEARAMAEDMTDRWRDVAALKAKLAKRLDHELMRSRRCQPAVQYQRWMCGARH